MRAAAASLLAVAVLFASGCGGSREQTVVDAAIARAEQVQKIAYAGKAEVAVEKSTPFGVAGTTSAGGASGSTGAAAPPPVPPTELDFTGAADDSGASASKSQLDMIVQSVNVRAVSPGDGMTYVVSPAGTFGAPQDADASTRGGFASVLRALRPVLDDFRPANDDRTRDGERLAVYAATASAEKFCARVAPAFSDYMDVASANVSSVKNLTGDAPLADVCVKLLQDDPTLWFGIDSKGMLRMVAMRAKLALLGAGSLRMTLRFDVTSYDEPVTIVKPDGATMLGSQEEMRRRSAVPSGG